MIFDTFKSPLFNLVFGTMVVVILVIWAVKLVVVLGHAILKKRDYRNAKTR